MNHQQILDAYKAATGAENMRLGRVTVELKTGQAITDYEQLEKAIRDFSIREGWLCYQSEVVTIDSDNGLPKRDDKILYGELAGENASLHIQGQGNSWWVTHIQEDAGEECLVKEQEYCISETQKARYQVFWKHLETGYQPDSYRFVGFIPANEGGE